MSESATREEVIDNLVDAFRRLGYDGASLTELSKATGLGKSSLYHYFPGGKEEMGRTALEHAKEALDELLVRVRVPGGSPQERLRRMLREVNDFYQGGRKLCILGNMVVSGGRQLFQRELADSFRLWIDTFADLVTEAGIPRREARVRAEDAVSAIQGALIVSAGLDQPGPFRRLLERLPQELFESGQSSRN